MSDRHRLGAKRWWRKVNVPLVAAALATTLSALAYAGHQKDWWTLPGVDAIELTTVDTRFRLRGEQQPKSDHLVIVGVDDETRARYPEVFQTRRGWAKLLRALDGYQPRAIGLDLFFAAPEVALSPETVAKVRDAARAFRADPADKTPAASDALAALDAVIEETRGDQLLAEAIAASKRIYLGVLFYLPQNGEAPAKPGAYEAPDVALARYGEAVAVDAPPSRRPVRATYGAGSLDEMARGAVGAGALNVLPDPDGGHRRIPLVIEYAGQFYMPMGLTMALAQLGVDASYVVGDEFVQIGDRRAPVNPRGEAYISHLGPNKTFPRVSAADVIDGTADRSALEGKLVLVGFADTARDKIETPFDTQVDGVEIHATLAHNLIHGELLRPSSPGTTLLTIIALGGLLTLVQIRRIRQTRSWVTGAAVLVVTAGYLIAAHLAFSRADLILEVTAPLGAALFVSLVALAAALVTEGRDKRQLRHAFEQYVSETLVDRIVKDLETNDLSLGGERRELTVLFSDIRGFSRFSEKLEPEVLSDYLNEYLTPMTEVVMEHDGLLDKYIGDAVMAVYGAPLSMTDHADHACQAALDMLARLKPLNASWRQRGLPEIAIGIGINTGPMSVGNMGSRMLFDYTVMGDAVNLAARLEALTKAYGVNVLCGETTAELAGDRYVFREIDLVRVVGRNATARVYELVGAAGDDSRLSDEDLATFADALAAYRARDWNSAEAGFRAVLDRRPIDGPSAVMLARVQHLAANPPPDDWDGVYAQVSK